MTLPEETRAFREKWIARFEAEIKARDETDWSQSTLGEAEEERGASR